MEALLFTSFVITSMVLIVIPGPNVLVIVSTSMVHGTRSGLRTVAGTSCALLMQLIIAALATNWLVESLTEGLDWLRWLGVAYLLYLGLRHTSRLFAPVTATGMSVGGTFRRGFLVSLTNPKTILFFGAFLPQFVTEQTAYLWQIGVLSASFLLLATASDMLYAVLAGRLGDLFQRHRMQRWQDGLSGGLFLGVAAWLALRHQSE